MAILAALAAASCARQQQAYVIDPATGQPVPVAMRQSYAPQRTYAQAQGMGSDSERGLFGARPVVRAYAAPPQPVYVQPVRQAYVQPPSVLQYRAPSYEAAQAAAPQYVPAPVGGPYVAVPYGYAAASPYEPAYTLDAGDKLRVVVFGQDGISNSYIVDAGGNVNLPLIGSVRARGLTIQQLSQAIAARLRQGYVREPHVSVEVETYRPFFILGEVTNPGQYPYVADITVEKAIAIAGGFAPRAYKGKVELSRSASGQQFKGDVPLSYPMRPGDTVLVKERWF